MILIADRFAVQDEPTYENHAVDLATGGRVVVMTSSAGGPSDALRWSERCDRLFRLHHPAIAPLADYGLLGESSRFEAWCCGERWTGDRADAVRARDRAQLFLRAEGLSSGVVTLEQVRTFEGHAVVLPHQSVRAGSAGDTAAAGPVPLDACGLATIERTAIAAVAEIIEHVGGASPRAVAIRTAHDGVPVAVRQLARMARQRGLVPVAARALETPAPGLLDLIGGRTLCLIEHRGGRHGWRCLVRCAMDAPKPHLLLCLGPADAPCGPGMSLERVAPGVLAASVRPVAVFDAWRERIVQLAGQAHGCPVRFARLLWGCPTGARERLAVRSHAAERSPAYNAPAAATAGPVNRYWPGDVSSLEARLDRALVQLESGRHAAGERAVRAAIGGLGRRAAWGAAARGQLALGWSLIKRGRPRAALTVLAGAAEYASRAGERHLLLVAAATGHARLDDGHLDEAESTLTPAFAAARTLGDAEAALACATALGRCLFWRGRYDEADAVLGDTEPVPGHTDAVVRLNVARSRGALGRRDLTAAMSHALTACERARELDRAALIAQATEVAALAHAWAGDREAMERDIVLCLRAAHAAHDPMRALKARLIAFDARGRSDERTALKRLLARAGRVPLPLTVRARVALAADLLNGSDVAGVVNRHVTATGLAALPLFLRADVQTGHGAPVGVEVLVDLLTLCQSAEDDAAVLPAICARVRQRLRAVAVALFCCEGKGVVQVAAEGGRVDSPMACRVAELQQAIPAHQLGDRIEGGVPIRYGGDVIGVLVARWTVATPPDPARAHGILTMTATAAGPAVAAARARRQEVRAAPLADLLGVSSGMAGVRSAVERAAAAPFPVLIEGESGSGKELVACALHRRGPRRDRPFCTLNCAAMPDDLIDAELFGHTRGAFTGALADRPGVFEGAHLGTLFLDEIGELSPRAQAKLLRALQEGEVRRIGENIARRVDVRIVAATNRDLRQEAAGGRFRTDLVYRLDVVRITVPPLRERREDIPVLAEHFWRDATTRVGSRAVLGAATIAALVRYDWPGNVRELQNVLAALAVRCPKRGVVPPAALPPPFAAAPTASWTLDTARRTFEERFVRAALVRTGGHRARAAEELGVSRQGLAKLMTRLQIAD